MLYAVRRCGNPHNERYQRPIEFITEWVDEDNSEAPLERKTKKQILTALEGNKLFEAGWVEIIEID